MNEDKHPEIRVRVSMFGDFRFSHLSGILWECGTAERSEASTALVARTRVRAKKNMATCVAETKAQLTLRTPYGHSSRFTSIFLFLRSFFYCY